MGSLKSIFPEEMMKSPSEGLTLEVIAGKLTYFHEQLHLLHWQTKSYAEHMALGGLYDYVHDVKDEIVEKLMGYCGKTPQPYKIEPLINTSSDVIVNNLLAFSCALKEYGEKNAYHDICNISDALSGEAAKVKYLLTLS